VCPLMLEQRDKHVLNTRALGGLGDISTDALSGLITQTCFHYKNVSAIILSST
jgi:hypothetical protein